MRKRKSRRSRRKSKEVHCVFETHSPSEPFIGRRVRKYTKTIIVENSRGSKAPFSEEEIKRIRENDTYTRTMKQILLDAAKRGKKVVAGETASGRELRKLDWLAENKEILKLVATIDLSLPSIKKFFHADAEFHRYRHGLILRTVKRATRRKELPIELIYGTFHSLLAADLRKRGYRVSREIEGQQFSWGGIVTRMLLLGKKPKDIEYKKGFISILFGRFYYELITGKKIANSTDRDLRFYNMVERALLDNLTEEQIDEVLRNCRDEPWLVFTLNGLPKRPTKKQLVEFLNEHSEFWRRQQRHRRAQKSE